MKNIYQKLKDWYRGKFISLSIQELLDLIRQNRRYLENQELNVPDRFERPLVVRIINVLWRFLLNHWKWLISTLIALGVLIAMLSE